MTGKHEQERRRITARLRAGHAVREADFASEIPERNVDGGARIERLAARMRELRLAGMNINSRPESGTDRHAVYTLQATTFERPVRTVPLRLDNGLDRVHNCRQCFGLLADPSQACDPSRTEGVGVLPGNYELGCRIDEVRARVAARRADEVRHAA